MEGSEVTGTSTIQKAVESSLTWGWDPSPYLHTECDLRELRQSPTSLVAEIPPLAIHLFAFNL